MEEKNSVVLVISGRPVPEPRGRSFRRKGGGMGVRADPKGDDWKRLIRRQALEQVDTSLGPVFSASVPLTASFRFLFFSPDVPVGEVAPAATKEVGDLDNLIKAAQDALSPWTRSGKRKPGIIFSEDGQVVEYHRCGKLLTGDRAMEGMTVIVEPWTGMFL